MFTQIQVEMDLLITEIEKVMDIVAEVRANEHNANIYIEYGGRLIGLTEAETKIRQTQTKINAHIANIVKNTTDGNYLMKVDLLEDENAVLQDKINLLQEELAKYTRAKRVNKSNLDIQDDCLRELSSEEIDNKINEAYMDNYIEVYEDEEDGEK